MGEKVGIGLFLVILPAFKMLTVCQTQWGLSLEELAAQGRW